MIIIAILVACTEIVCAEKPCLSGAELSKTPDDDNFEEMHLTAFHHGVLCKVYLDSLIGWGVASIRHSILLNIRVHYFAPNENSQPVSVS